MAYSNVSNDLIWEITKNQSAFLVKRGNFTFSKDPLNVTNKNSRTSSGLANDKAVGVSEVDDRITLKTRTQKSSNKPSQSVYTQSFKSGKSSRRVALAVSNTVKGYREDLRVVAVKKASQYSRAKTQRKTYEAKSRK
ncbi:ribosomal protein L28e [Ascoidea rubescens DSM 1968]|uniref:Ribosomal protein L28e n=1 Tax=Ascoidea rubescens DSM 1968 TaxID=1344418 RepID=A0A1D2VFZ7_9ASCO|nr:ribosomal protein L28e [Ascoidea rubescens DSM 1968]ODV60581.1 ribosomal protein L28e [Ascoidea rubescens DSM 1968]